jgi:hypothetical protein
MRIWNRKTVALAAPALLVFASSAMADATIDGDLRATVSKGKKFEVAADVTMSNKGVVTLQGTVDSQPFELRKKFKTKAGKSKTKTIKFKIDPKKLGIRDANTTIILQASMNAQEEGQAEPANAVGGAALPPPLLIVPGTGNELAGPAYNPFRDALNQNAGSPWLTKGKRATLKIQTYQSLSIGPIPMEKIAEGISKAADKMIKKSLFVRCDIVAHSLGGIVVRHAMLPAATGKKKVPPLAGRVRNCFFMGVTQSGSPLAYMAQSAIQAAEALGIDPKDLVGDLLEGIDNPVAADLADLLLNKSFLGVVRAFLPSNRFAIIPTQGGPMMVNLPTLSQGADIPPLFELNNIPPDEQAMYHALYYEDVPDASGDVRTVVALDLVAFLSGGGTDLGLVELLNGPGDGVVPVTSTLMEDHPAWNARLQPVPLGEGVHTPSPGDDTPGYWNDPDAIGYILTVATQP